ncbi:cysteine--tRNA ligase [Patescibacteria group bacterium]|nr:cysteine--tRNA ligase [Patescibacteria group bacterium]
MKLYNTLSRKIEEFMPIKPPQVEMYSCGPTVYDTAHIGNFRTYVLHDILRRSLQWLDYQVKLVSNITDVGHLVSDADEGEDKLEKGAKREGLTAWYVAKKYTLEFFNHEKMLNILPPDVRCKATDYIKEQVDLVQTLESKGFTYKTKDGIYFDTSKINDYGQLIGLDKSGLKEGARIEPNPEKKNPTDFALWKFSPKGKKRDMEWSSPWGIGFPGWHIECSAMSMKNLGEQLDIHVGGADIKSTHHVNEIAQSEAATGKKPFVRYWVHGELLKVDGGRMGKSLGNAHTLNDLLAKGYEPLTLRYLYLTTHYRSYLNFTFSALTAAGEAYARLKSITADWQGKPGRSQLSPEKLKTVETLTLRFRAAVEADLNLPQALAVVWEMVKSNIPEQDKRELISDWDQVLGLDLTKIRQIPAEIKQLMHQREELRRKKQWAEADQLRQQIIDKGYKIEDEHA